jgi:ketosteroid isomerase-like protein
MRLPGNDRFVAPAGAGVYSASTRRIQEERTMRTCVSIFAAGVVLAASGCKPSVDLEKERSALLKTDSEWMHSANDAGKFASYYTADALFDAPGAPAVKGQAAIRDAFKQLNSAPGFGLEWRILKSKVADSGDLAYTTGTYQLKLTGGGETGKYVTVWVKQPDGTWRVTDDIFNSDEPPPPPASGAGAAQN